MERGRACNTIGLASRGIEVDFLEICRLQADFIKFRAERRNLNNVREIRPYYQGNYDAILPVRDLYDAIVVMDVLEHIPKYDVVLKHLIGVLKPGGMILENTPFNPAAEDIDIHIKAHVPFEDAMISMERIDVGIWRKKQ